MITTADLCPHIDVALIQIIGEFLTNPVQFHGDTGIMHSWYHWMRDSGPDIFFQAAPGGAAKALLLWSEYYTQLPYLERGATPSQGRLDYALLRPEAVRSDGSVDETKPPLIGVEVGLGKAIDDMGDMTAPEDQKRVKPGDAAKLIREIRFKGMELGYLLEFYSSREEVNKAYTLSQEVRQVLAETGVQLRMAVVLRRNPREAAMVDFYPAEWGETIRAAVAANHAVVPMEFDKKIEADTARRNLEGFKKNCNPCNAALQDAIKTLPGLPRRSRPLYYGSKTMSINIRKTGEERVKIAQIGNKVFEHGECIFKIAKQFADELKIRGLPIDRIPIPLDKDQWFIQAITDSLSSVLSRHASDQTGGSCHRTRQNGS